VIETLEEMEIVKQNLADDKKSKKFGLQNWEVT
jgi:hypothetical protein